MTDEGDSDGLTRPERGALTRRVLVTGGSGFIGTHLVSALAERGDEISNVDIEAPNLAPHHVHWTRLDILDDVALARHIEAFRPDIIFNLAAIADLSLGRAAMRVNTAGLENVLRAAAKLDRMPRLVHTSTQMIARPGYVISGPRDYDPYTEYGETKAASEEILHNWGDDSFWTIVRPTMIWGPWHQLLAGSTWRYLNRRWYMIVRGRDPLRNYGYVRNLVAQLIAIGDADLSLVAGRTFYGGDPPVRTSAWIDGFARALTGKPARRVPYRLLWLMATAGEMMGKIGLGSPINHGRLYRMTSAYVADTGPTDAALGPPPIPLDQGIKETVQWLREWQPAEFGPK